MYSLDQLESFVAVAEELHYGRAAARLRITQPPLSRRIQLLERELGVALFDRSRRAVRLTPAGRAFLADARRVLHLAREAALSARRVPRGDAGVVTVGFTAATAYGFLERVLAAAGERLPHVELVLRERVTAAQVEELTAGAVDVGLVRPPVSGADLVSEHLLREALLAAVPAGHGLAVRPGPLTLGDLDGEPFVMYSPAEARYFHEVLAGVFREAGVRPAYVQYVSQVHTVLAMVRARLGVALVPAAAGALRFEGVVLRPVADLPEEPVELAMAWRRGNDNPALGAVLEVVRGAGRAAVGSGGFSGSR